MLVRQGVKAAFTRHFCLIAHNALIRFDLFCVVSQIYATRKPCCAGMKMKIDFSTLNENHVTGCATLYQTVYKEAPWFETSELEPVINFIKEHLKNNFFRGYIAWHDDKMVAVSIGFKKPWPGGVEYYIDEFFVDPACQGRGVGSALMNFIAEQALKEGLNAIILNTHKHYPSDFFYRKNGFDEHPGLIILSRTLR